MVERYSTRLKRVCTAKRRALEARDFSRVRVHVRRSIDRALSDLGIPDHLLGYAYLQSAITLVVQQPDAAYAVTSCIYPTVAMRYSTTAQLVERAIRHAVERGWSRCDSTMREMYFGGKIRPNRQKPTNAEFIARIANLVRG